MNITPESEDWYHLIMIGAYHYEALLIENDLLNPETFEIRGEVDYTTWAIKILEDFKKIFDDELQYNLSNFLATIANAYVMSKALLIGIVVYDSGKEKFADWSNQMESQLSHQEMLEVKPRLIELHERVRNHRAKKDKNLSR